MAKFEPWAQEAFNQIDAGLYSSDAFYSIEAIAKIRDYLDRWECRLKEIEREVPTSG